ncbi:hypothetical protein A3E15_01330 [Candidatus Woesebacteria bacterium RIFCSPHIGHO2_12_FULL_42_9]|uniref:Uncharacterized protein n=3 Tax=Candidatus Woeseibacteriota TaxID=1752722 RepID=A0A1F8ASE3_9BACT|nr:MAG: hypothetical protein A2112_01155 [Candidatus Woesebacteria bacterium GWA1_42_12]OGM07383.1 MAG: hypothetical protein A2129_02445 [Candidatus Woesebacteria bacterium GWC1_42_13]OGM54611.1 MAG: hypothetical protein A3E15_01330 [Candidatus Woesebacteria bacterium RIFCSPHIGHO2_12_FULL_42_9]
METLATFFVGLVAFANSMAPQANLPQILGVRVLGEDDEVSTVSADVDDGEDEDVGERSRSELKKRLAQVNEDRKDALEEIRASRRVALEAAKKAREEALDEAKARREEFKEQLEELRDERKAKVVENIDERLAAINEKWINHFNKILGRLSEILTKIQGRADALAEDGVDVTEVNSAIADAQAAIDAAQAAVDAQAGKVYIIGITGEENLGENVSEVIHELRADIAAVRELVKDARRSVHDAFKALKDAAGEPDEDEDEGELTPTVSVAPTSTPTPTPTL